MTPRLRLARTTRAHSPFSTIEAALDSLRAGRMIVVVDDEDRENEGDLTMAASAVTPESINFMVTRGRGLVCLAMTPERLDELEIPLEVSDNSSRRETAMCVSIDAKHGSSARSRCRRRSARPRSPAISRGPVMCFPCARGRAVC
jgi:3,4-dihydroxy 2-butanone 4-phosphate synthase/GTP cyclohydrolase II